MPAPPRRGGAAAQSPRPGTGTDRDASTAAGGEAPTGAAAGGGVPQAAAAPKSEVAASGNGGPASESTDVQVPEQEPQPAAPTQGAAVGLSSGARNILNEAANAATSAFAEDADGGDGDGDGSGGGSACFRLRHVRVHGLLEDGTLGLLLHGTSVVGFCSPQAEEAGWRIGDQIVEVNGQRVAVFDEFLDCFVAAQEDGFPIDFSVLRRECLGDPDGGAEDALEGFFSATNFTDLAGQLQKKAAHVAPVENSGQGGAGRGDEDPRAFLRAESITENPYIQALRKRRNELFRSAEGWTSEVVDSLASRLATQREDGLATLTRNAMGETPRSQANYGFGYDGGYGGGGGGMDRYGADFESFAWAPCMQEQGTCASREAALNEIQPTPRVARMDQDSVDWEQMPTVAWPVTGLESGGDDLKEGAQEGPESESRNFAVKLLTR